MNYAAVVRRSLTEAREAGGVSFDSAWDEALAALPLDADDDAGPAERRELDCWRGALRWSRSFFQAAYLREPWSQAEAAAGALEEMAA